MGEGYLINESCLRKWEGEGDKRGGGEARNGGRKTSEEGFFGTSHSAAAFPRKMEGSKSKKEQRYLV